MFPGPGERDPPMFSGRGRMPSWQRQGTLMGIVAQVLKLSTGCPLCSAGGPAAIRSSPRASRSCSPDPCQLIGGSLLSSILVLGLSHSTPNVLLPRWAQRACEQPVPCAGGRLELAFLPGGSSPIRAFRDRGAGDPSRSKLPRNLLYFSVDSWGPVCPGRAPSLGQASLQPRII